MPKTEDEQNNETTIIDEIKTKPKQVTHNGSDKQGLIVKSSDIEKKEIKKNSTTIESQKVSPKSNDTNKQKIDIKGEFCSIENVINKMYSEVFSKSEKFRTTRSETLGDLLIYVGEKCRLLNAKDNFEKVFGVTIIEDSERAKDGYIPLVLKLTSWLDKKQNTSYSALVIEKLFNVLSGLLGELNDSSQAILENIMVKLYNFVKEIGVNV